MRKIKILHITQSNCGIEEYLKMYFKYMDNERYEFELICPQYEDMVRNITLLGVKVYIVDMKREISIYNDIKSFIKICKYIKMYKPDIIHAHSSKAGVLGRFAAYINKIPCIYTAHGWSFGMNISKLKKKFYASIERYCAKFTYKIINISEYEQKLALSYKIAPLEKLPIIYNGIDINRYETTAINKIEVLRELNIPEDSFIIGMVARLTKAKSPETFIKVAKIVSVKIPNSYFILVGDGELRQQVEEQIVNNNLQDKFLITGWTYEVEKYISLFDIALLTSKWEGFGLAITEYLAAGVPVIASNVGGITNIILDGYNGYLIEPDNINGFSEKILLVHDNFNIRDLIVNNGRLTVKTKFDINRVVSEHKIIYENIFKEYCMNNLNEQIS